MYSLYDLMKQQDGFLYLHNALHFFAGLFCVLVHPSDFLKHFPCTSLHPILLLVTFSFHCPMSGESRGICFD